MKASTEFAELARSIANPAIQEWKAQKKPDKYITLIFHAAETPSPEILMAPA